MPWKLVTLTNDEIVSGKHARLQDEFAAIFMAHGAPPEAAMYCSQGARERGKYFFTPSAADLAPVLLRTYGAVDCDEPELAKLAVLVKNSGSRAGG